MDIIRNHQHLKLITVDAHQSVMDVLKLFQKYDISQIPVTENNDFVGSVSDNYSVSENN
ncbi:MAG: hypothetical protein KatS3mg028_0807 [Bacteroidia bacterium]|nr:MAG: hypothetical protein KatS3mg028_0807 [Bacteroidia bacterium]